MVEFLRAGLSAACGTVSWPCFIEYRRGILRKKLVKFGKLMRDRTVLCMPLGNTPPVLAPILSRFIVTPGPATYTVGKTIDWIVPLLVYSTHQLIICLWRRALKSGLLLLCGHSMHEQCIIAMRRCVMCYSAVRMICSQESFARSLSSL